MYTKQGEQRRRTAVCVFLHTHFLLLLFCLALPACYLSPGTDRYHWECPRAMRIGATEVKFLDRCGTSGSEGALLDRIRQSRTRVWGSKMIRYRRSPPTVNGACSVSIRVFPLTVLFPPSRGVGFACSWEPTWSVPLLHPTRNPEPLGSGGSTVARLKLKGIDGMTPQGVEYAA